ncbi:ABC transporter ATP-binding protein [Pseudoalteromonas sp. MMG013]|uniref:ABC transporter ATP-binding protein n=1 Tax=Pseudoalteromonas sp. MMG013 TaxID=2822687 RepID=UPI001B375FC6|nr:ABC transporter ATP-binding protein [Pseudoalteromonas sp. MMG013]MBQ4862210.1 ABC transporter ATP-binding protein [Pseudoalteromonas sp. MMG013]
MKTTKTLIQLKGITKVHQTSNIETTALNNIDLEINEGDFVSIMGPSGGGKSTLLNMLGLLDSPSTGQYFFNGKELAGWSENQRADIRRSNIGVIFQSFNLIDELTVFQNIELALRYQGVPAAQRKDKVETVLKRVALDHRASHYPKQLSGGQQQRVAIARAIVGEPKVLLADEPTGNLDSTNGDQVMHLLKELNSEGTTVIMVTHSSEHANFASRIVRILDGTLVPESAIDAVKDKAVAAQEVN